MIAVIYRTIVRPKQEASYQACWTRVSRYFVKYRGAIASTLHKGDDGLWMIYSRWPDQQTRAAAWPGEDAPSEYLPVDIREAIEVLQKIKKENVGLEQYPELVFDVVDGY